MNAPQLPFPLPRGPYPTTQWPAGMCCCIGSTCRGGQVAAGRTVTGALCRQCQHTQPPAALAAIHEVR